MGYQSKHQGQTIDNNIDIINEFLNKTYPIGSIYMNINNTNPGTLFGGTWEQIQDRFLLAAGSSYDGGSTGGTASHTHTTAAIALTEAQMPKHYHSDMHWGGPTGYQFGVNNTNEGGFFRFTYSGEASEASFYTGYAGSGATHSHGDTGSSSNLPPYLTVYIWKRIA